MQDQGKPLLDLRFADDVVIFAKSAAEASFLLDVLVDEFKKVGDLITKIIVGLSKNPDNNSKTETEVKKEVIELCSKFPIYNHLVKK